MRKQGRMQEGRSVLQANVLRNLFRFCSNLKEHLGKIWNATGKLPLLNSVLNVHKKQ